MHAWFYHILHSIVHRLVMCCVLNFSVVDVRRSNGGLAREYLVVDI